MIIKTTMMGLILLFVLFSFIIVYVGCGDKSSQPVARIGGRLITASDFETQFSRGKSPAALTSATLEEKIKSLNKMIEKELQLVAAYRLNLDKNDEIIGKVNERAESAVLRRLIDLEVIEPNIKESEIKDVYKKSKKDVSILDLYIKWDKNASDDEKKISEQKLKTINEELKRDMDFDELLNKYSMDTKTQSGKKATPKILKWNVFNSTDPIYIAAFSMKTNEISKPITSSDGYHIIKIVSIDKIKNIKPYSEERERIKNEILRLRGNDLEKKYFEYIDKLHAKYNVSVVSENVEKFLEISHDTSRIKNEPNVRRDDVSVRFTDDEKKLLLVTFSNGQMSIGEFLDEINKFPVMRQPMLNTKTDIETFLNRRIIAQKVLSKEAEIKNVKNDDKVKELLDKYKEDIMSSNIQKLEVNDKISITDIDKKKYYDENMDEFKTREKREVQEILVSDEKLAQQIVQRAKSKENFTKLVKIYNERAATKNKDGNRGYIYEATPTIGKPAFETDVNGIAGPIKNGNKYSIIKVLNIEKPEYKTYEESKETIQSKLEREFRDKRYNEWIEQLRKEIDVTIYENRLDNTFSIYKAD